ncbi:MAG: cyclic nucleotide-binding domain-containing protein [Methylotetracoccus sp.]
MVFADEHERTAPVQRYHADAVACSHCNLARIHPCGMSAREVRPLSDTVRRNRTLQKGETIYHAGDLFSGVFALRSGTAKLVHGDRSGKESIISIMLPGEILGFNGISSGRYGPARWYRSRPAATAGCPRTSCHG